MNGDAYHGQIDSLRAWAVLAVLFHHYWGALPFLGHLGVRLFFVISGYLITGILLRCRDEIDAGFGNRGIMVWRFLIRRALRIFPAYYALLMLVYAVDFPGVRESVWWHVGYASNALFATSGAFEPWVTAHFWSLSVEEQFYLFWPFVILFAPRPRLLALILSVIAAALLFRAGALVAGVGDTARWTATPASLDALAAGGLLALFNKATPFRTALRRAAIPALIAFVAVRIFVETGVLTYHSWQDYLLLEAISTLFLLHWVAAAAGGAGGWHSVVLSWGITRYVGRISYGIYLFHVPVVATFWNWQAAEGMSPIVKGPLLFLLLTPVTIAIAALSWDVLERPLSGLKNRFPYVGARAKERIFARG